MAHFKVIIIGGGLSGALLANGLLNNHISCTLYERDTEDSKREGYQIRLGEYSIIGFRSCLTKECMDAIMKKFGHSSGATATGPAIYNTRWEEVIDFTLLPGYSKSAAINRVVLRDMLMGLVKAKRCVRYQRLFQRYEIIEQGGREMVKVHFQTSEPEICDILIGADGSGSKINKQLGAQNLVQLESHWSFVSKGDLPVARLNRMPKRLKKGPIMIFKKGVAFYYALYMPTIKQAGHTNDPKTKQEAEEIGYDESSASYYWVLHIPRSEIPYDHISAIPDPRRFCIDRVHEWGWAEQLKDLIHVGSDDTNARVEVIQFRASKPLSTHWRARVQRQAQCPEEGHPRVWLLGDAIHAMQPNRGQGGNQAMCDTADMLPELIMLNDLSVSSETPPTSEQIRAACQRYEDKMIPRAFTWVERSGGTSFPNFDFDGILGTLLKLVSWIVLPAVRVIYNVVYRQTS